jgi:hypothetical protein
VTYTSFSPEEWDVLAADRDEGWRQHNMAEIGRLNAEAALRKTLAALRDIAKDSDGILYRVDPQHLARLTLAEIEGTVMTSVHQHSKAPPPQSPGSGAREER